MKNELFIPIIVAVLTIAFAVVCTMVYLSSGKHYWVKKKLRIGALLLMFNGIVYGTNAQENSCYLIPDEPKSKIFIGPILGMMYNSFKDPIITKNNAMPVFSLSNSQIPDTNFYFGLTYEEPLGNLETSTSSFIFRLVYETKSVSYDKLVNKTTKLYIDPTNPTDTAVFEIPYYYHADYNYSDISLDIMYKQNISTGFPLGFAAGFAIAIPITKSSFETYSIRSNVESVKFSDTSGAKVIDKGQTLMLKDGKINNTYPIQIGLKFQIQYEIIPWQSASYFVPEIGYSYPLLKVQSTSNWKISSFYIGVSWRFGVRSPF